MNALKGIIGAASLAVALTAAGLVNADALRAHTTAPGAAPNTTTKLLAKYAEDAGIDVQVIEGQK